MAKLQVPDQPELASKIVESQVRREERALEMGWIGALFGDVHHKPGNIAGFVIVMSMLFLGALFVVSYIWPNTNNVPVGELMTLFGGIVTLALGYLFGKSGKE